MRSFVLVLALAATGLSFTAQDTGLKLTVQLDKASYVLNDDIQVSVTLTNDGEAVDISDLVLEERSLALEIEIPVEGGKNTYTWAISRGDPHITSRLPLPVVTLGKGKSLTKIIRLPAIQLGEVSIKAVFNGAKETLTSTAAKAEVKEAAAGKKLVAILEIEDKGNIRIDLNAATAPLSVTNFVTLAKRGFYDDMIIHRVIKYQWIHTGCPYGLGIGGPGYTVPSEHGKQNKPPFDFGTVAFSSYKKLGHVGSQFFMCTGRAKSLDGKFPVFGKVTDDESKSVLKKVGRASTDTSTDRPKTDIKLKRITISVVQ